MKAIQYFKIVLPATVVLFSACSKEDDTNPDAPCPFVIKDDNQSFTNAELEFAKAKYVSSTRYFS